MTSEESTPSRRAASPTAESEARSRFDEFLAEVDWGCSKSRPANSFSSLHRVLTSEREVQRSFFALALEWKPGLDHGPTWSQIADRDTHRLELLGEVLGELLRTADTAPALVALVRHLRQAQPVLDPVAERAKQAKMAAELGLRPLEVAGLPAPDPDRLAAWDRASRVQAALDQQALPVESVLAAVAAAPDRSDPELRAALAALKERLAALEILDEPEYAEWMVTLDTLLA